MEGCLLFLSLTGSDNKQAIWEFIVTTNFLFVSYLEKKQDEALKTMYQ